MTEYSAKQAALRAKAELELTSKAFAELRKRLRSEIEGAQSAEDAYQGVLALRALNSVVKSLEAMLDTPLIDEHYSEQENG